MNMTHFEESKAALAALHGQIISYGLCFTIALLILVSGWLGAKLIRKISRNVLMKILHDPTLASFLSNVAYIFTLIVVCVAALNEVGFHTTSLVAILGAMGLAVGLAFKGSLSNFASGIAIIIFKPFKVGDTIGVDGLKGVVEELNIFSTRLCSPNNEVIYVPNAKLTDTSITNFTSKLTRRLDLRIPVSYESDVDHVKRTLVSIVEAEPLFLKEPQPLVALDEFADSSINFVVRPWIYTKDYWKAYHNLMYNIKKRFEEEAIEIPYAKLDIHLKQTLDNDHIFVASEENN